MFKLQHLNSRFPILRNTFSFFFSVCFSEYYPTSLMDKLLSAMYLISSERDMQQSVQFPPVVGFVDIQSCV